MPDAARAVAFLRAWFRGVEGHICLSALPRVRELLLKRDARDAERTTKFIERESQPGQGLYFCVAALRPGAGKTEAGSWHAGDKVGRVAGAYVEIDFKDLIEGQGQAEVLGALHRACCPASAIVLSGGGAHGYWRYREPLGPEQFARHERLLHNLVEAFAGDAKAATLAQLMRLPGTENWKRVTESEPEPRSVLMAKSFVDGHLGYTLEGLEAMSLNDTGLRRRSDERHEPADDPYERFAEEHGIAGPLDVEATLAGMRAGNVHSSMMALVAHYSFYETDDAAVFNAVYPAVFEASQGRTPRERTAKAVTSEVRKAIAWCRKKEQRDEGQEPNGRDGEGAPRPNGEDQATDETVIDLSAARAKREKAKTGSAAERLTADQRAQAVAEAAVKNFCRHGRELLLTEDGLYVYEAGRWHPLTRGERQGLAVTITELAAKHSSPKLARAAWHAIETSPALFRGGIEWDASGLWPVRNGMLDPTTREIVPHDPGYYATRQLPFDYDARASAEPYLEHLRRTFDDGGSYTREEQADLIAQFEEFLATVPDVRSLRREQRCALWLTGASGTGKSELGQIIRGFTGGPVGAPTVKQISGPFGLAHLLHQAAWISDEAAEASDQLSADTFKVLVTGEPVDVAIKNHDPIRGHRFAIPVVLIANNLPRVTDETRAVFNRSIVIECRTVFAPDKAVWLAKELGVTGTSIGAWLIETCGCGILNRVLDARDALMRRGRHELRPCVQAALAEFRRDTSAVAAFVEEALEHVPGAFETRADILASMHGWQQEQDGAKARLMSGATFWRRLRKASPWLDIDARGHGGVRRVRNVSLTEAGRCWRDKADNSGG